MYLNCAFGMCSISEIIYIIIKMDLRMETNMHACFVNSKLSFDVINDSKYMNALYVHTCVYAQDGDNNYYYYGLSQVDNNNYTCCIILQSCYNFKVNVDSHRSYYSMKNKYNIIRVCKFTLSH